MKDVERGFYQAAVADTEPRITRNTRSPGRGLRAPDYADYADYADHADHADHRIRARHRTSALTSAADTPVRSISG